MNDKSEILNILIQLKDQIDTGVLLPSLEPGGSELVQNNPYAFCVATCLDRGTKADIIWTIPYWLSLQVGHFDPKIFYTMTIEEISVLFNRLPKKPRYTNDAPKTFHAITKIVVEKFDGDAAKIWENRSATEVKRTFQLVHGVGNGIANMAVLLIEKAFGVQFPDNDRSKMDIKPDVHTMRVLYRLGLAKEKNEIEAIIAARTLSPDYPGNIDGPLWYLGRNYCHSTNPNCKECPLLGICPRVDL